MFIHLKCHSHYSFLRAVPSPQELIATAAEQARIVSASPACALPESLRGGAVALTDTNGLYAAVPFYQAARKAGVKPIIGAELDFTFEIPDMKLVDERVARKLKAKSTTEAQRPQSGTKNHNGDYFDPDTSRASAFEFAEHETHKTETWHGPKLTLLAANATGYRNLCRLVTQRQIEERPLTLEELNEFREGLVALYFPWCPPKNEERKTKHGTDHRPLSTGHLKDIFGAGLYLEARRLAPGDGRALRDTLRLGVELGVPVVATNNVHFIKPEEHLHHRVLNAIRTGSLVSAMEHAGPTKGPAEITSAEAYFKSALEMQRAFPDHPELLRATLEIAEQCNLELTLGKTIFPDFPVPASETAFSYLWKLSFAGAQRRYQPLHPDALRRLTHELEVIDKLHLAPYFLLVWDIVEEARRRGIPAVARGSAASSIVTYCLGISRVCPLRWNLYFERFLNEQRGDIPDIDLDICGVRRDELLDYVYKRWGQEYVAMIGSFVTMHARMAIREVAKVFGVPNSEVNHFTRRLPHRPVREILEAIRTLPECRTLPAADEPWKTILQVALRLGDFPRHLGIHPCGTVIAAPVTGGLANLAPLEWATKGIVVTQYDMHAVEALGLVKMDLLGQRGLTTMSLALKNIGGTGACGEPAAAGTIQPVHFKSQISDLKSPCHSESAVADEESAFRQHSAHSNADSSHGQKAPAFGMTSLNPTLDFDAIPEGDPVACSMVARGQTLGIFQIESPGMRGLLRTMQARTLEEISLALALIRPGAAEYGSKESFLRRIRGTESVRYPHPCLEPILRDTLGICIYQEQVMQIAQVAGAMSLAESDLVRRASAKFADARERERLRSKFLKSAEQLGLTGEARESSWHMVEKFAGFGFCKAHAATYADLSYRIAYLKAHYPAQFLAAMCSSGAGFYHVSAYVEEAKRLGIEVRLPSVNHSQMEYTAEPLECGSAAPALFSKEPATSHPKEDEMCATVQNKAGAALPHSKAIRIGLMQVRGLRAGTMARMVHSRETHGPYRSLEDFLRRVPVEHDEIEALIKCGAFDEVGQTSRSVRPLVSSEDAASAFEWTGLEACPTRPALLWQLNLHVPQEPETNRTSLLFPDAAPATATSDAALHAVQGFAAADYTREQRMRYEQEILEVCVSGHPLDLVPRNGENWSTDLSANVGARFSWPDDRAVLGAREPKLAPTKHTKPLPIGKRVTLLGWVITYRRVGTKTYRNMMFVTLEDQRGVYEAVLFPEAYERYGGLVFESRMLRVTGRLEAELTVNCEKLEAIRP